MFSLNYLPKSTTKSKKRIGRGYGSTKGGHTVSKGQKGQKVRAKVKLLFEGTKTNKDFFRRVPMLRGKGKLKSHQVKPAIIKTSALDVFAAGTIVTVKELISAKLVTEKIALQRGVKILRNQAITKPLTIQVSASKTAQKHLAVVKS